MSDAEAGCWSTSGAHRLVARRSSKQRREKIVTWEKLFAKERRRKLELLKLRTAMPRARKKAACLRHLLGCVKMTVRMSEPGGEGR